MPEVPNSILDTTKKALGIYPDDTNFDTDIVMHINSTFGILNQLGVGPDDGFEIEDSSTTWDEYLLNKKILNPVKTLMYLQVRLWFDPPTTSFDLAAKKEQLQELQSRINMMVDNVYIPPVVVVIDDE